MRPLLLLCLCLCACARALPTTVHTSVERVVFDDLPVGRSFSLFPRHHQVIVGWRVEVALRGRDGKLNRAVDWLYETRDEADDDETPPPMISQRAELMAQGLITSDTRFARASTRTPQRVP